jgi:hypothetical protein
MNMGRVVKESPKWTEEQCERLAQHFETQLGLIGVDWAPKGLPHARPIEIIPFQDWHGEDPANLFRWAYVRVLWFPWIDLALLQQSNGLVALPLDGPSMLSFSGFRMCAAPFSYGRLFRIAIHEGAHVLRWYELIRNTGNKFTPEQRAKAERSGHDRVFKRYDCQLLHQAQHLGLRKRKYVPNDIADLF